MGFALAPTRRGKGTKIVAIAACNSLPLAVSVESASPAECRLVEEVLAGSFLGELPARPFGDKAYDSDRLDEKLATKYGIQLISPTGAVANASPRMVANRAVTAGAGK